MNKAARNDHTHNDIVHMIANILNMAGITYNGLYEDPPHRNTQYPSIYGKSIKFWDISPNTGDRFDIAMYTINHYLQMHYGLMATTHIYNSTQHYHNSVDISYNGVTRKFPGNFVTERRAIVSIVVRPIPTLI